MIVQDLVFEPEDGTVRLEPLEDGSRRISIAMRAGRSSGPSLEWLTRYPPDLVEQILDVKGPGWLCDEIRRDEDPAYVAKALWDGLVAFIDPATLVGKRILDFGCGAGASSVVLTRLFPESEIVGVEFNADFTRLARARVAQSGARQVTILDQASALEVPALPSVDLIVLSAVIEHMLPLERRHVLPQLWERLALGGYVYVCDTPHRWFPVEAHTTGLFALNYQSDLTAYRRALALRRSDLRGAWTDMLRAGIRGSTEREIVDCLTSGHRAFAEMVSPTRGGIRTRLDLWFRGLTPDRKRLRKAVARHALRAIERLSGSLVTQNITLCLRKVG